MVHRHPACSAYRLDANMRRYGNQSGFDDAFSDGRNNNILARAVTDEAGDLAVWIKARSPQPRESDRRGFARQYPESQRCQQPRHTPTLIIQTPYYRPPYSRLGLAPSKPRRRRQPRGGRARGAGALWLCSA